VQHAGFDISFLCALQVTWALTEEGNLKKLMLNSYIIITAASATAAAFSFHEEII
jgi:hypothetical protein